MIAIVAVTKGFGVDECRKPWPPAARARENRVQEALSKMDAVPGAEWHLIRHLQTNKVKHAAGHSPLHRRLGAPCGSDCGPRRRRRSRRGQRAREPQHGIDPEGALDTILAVASLLPVRGLMAAGPAEECLARSRLRQLRDQAEQRLGKGCAGTIDGMSGDFEAAVLAGARWCGRTCALRPRPRFVWPPQPRSGPALWLSSS